MLPGRPAPHEFPAVRSLSAFGSPVSYVNFRCDSVPHILSCGIDWPADPRKNSPSDHPSRIGPGKQALRQVGQGSRFWTGSGLPRHWQPKLPQSDIVNWPQQCTALVVVRGESSEAVALQGDGAADRGAAVAGRLANQEKGKPAHRSHPGGQVLAARQVGGGKQTKEVNGTAKTSPDATQKRVWRYELGAMEPPVDDFAER